MKLKLTDVEFLMLVDLVYAGDWIINSTRLPQDRIKCYKDMSDRLLSILAEKQNCSPCDAENIGDAIGARLQSYFDFYSGRIMLESLAACLARREHGERLSLERSESEDAYLAEFSKNGLKNIRVNLIKKA